MPSYKVMEPTKPERNAGGGPEGLVGGQEALNQREQDEKLLESNWIETVENFEDLNLKKDLLRGIFDCGFVRPSLIQQIAIKPIIMKKNVIAEAQSGAGKTAAFVISMLQNIDHEDLKT